MSHVILCFDIGGSKLVTGLIDEDGKILRQERGAWAQLDQNSILEALYSTGEAALDWLKAENLPAPTAIGATIPGLADRERGIWLESSFSGIRDFPIRSEIEHHFHLPTSIDRDACACAMAEMRFGCCKGVKNFFYMTVSNGIGGAVVIDGRVYAGPGLGAGEIGHCRIAESGRRCKCGGTGCLEIQASGRMIGYNYIDLGGCVEADGSIPDTKRLAERARSGERTALETFRLEGRYLGVALAWAVNLLNPEKIVIGGGVSLCFDLYGRALGEALFERIYRKPNPNLTVEPTPLGYLEALYGAAALGFEAEGADSGPKWKAERAAGGV